MHNNLSVYSLNSRAEGFGKELDLRWFAKEKGFWRGFARRFGFLRFGLILGSRVIGKGAEYTYRKLGHYVYCAVGIRFWKFARGLVRKLF